MASTNFVDTVTRIPAEWANDTNTLVYTIFGGAQNLAAVKTVLGLSTMAAQGASAVAITGGTMNGVAIGGSAPAAGVFTTLRVSGAPNLGTDATNKTYVDGLFSGLGLGSMAFQASDSVAITGGTMSGVAITAPSGTFTALQTPNAPASANYVANKAYVDGLIAGLGTFGELARLDKDVVAFTGGTMDGVVIGADAPAAAQFTAVVAPLLSTASAYIDLAASQSGHPNAAISLKAKTSSLPDIHNQLHTDGIWHLQSQNGTSMVRVTGLGRLLLGTVADDGASTVQTSGNIVAGTMTLSGTITNNNQAATKAYVDESAVSAQNLAQSAVNAVGALGNMSAQSSNNVNVTGGAINGVGIGASTPATGQFTTVNTPTLQNASVGVTLSLSGAGSSALTVTAANGSYPSMFHRILGPGKFAVQLGTTDLFAIKGNGRVLIGNPTDDSSTSVQIKDGLRVGGIVHFGADPFTGLGNAGFGTGNSPANTPGAVAQWVKVKLTISGIETIGYIPVWV